VAGSGRAGVALAAADEAALAVVRATAAPVLIAPADPKCICMTLCSVRPPQAEGEDGDEDSDDISGSSSDGSGSEGGEGEGCNGGEGGGDNQRSAASLSSSPGPGSSALRLGQQGSMEAAYARGRLRSRRRRFRAREEALGGPAAAAVAAAWDGCALGRAPGVAHTSSMQQLALRRDQHMADPHGGKLETLALGTERGTLLFLDTGAPDGPSADQGGAMLAEMQAHRGEVISVLFQQSSQAIVTVGVDFLPENQGGARYVCVKVWSAGAMEKDLQQTKERVARRERLRAASKQAEEKEAAMQAAVQRLQESQRHSDKVARSAARRASQAHAARRRESRFAADWDGGDHGSSEFGDRSKGKEGGPLVDAAKSAAKEAAMAKEHLARTRREVAREKGAKARERQKLGRLGQLLLLSECRLPEEPCCLGLARSEPLLLVGYYTGFCQLLDLRTGRAVQQRDVWTHADVVTAGDVSEPLKLVVTCSLDKTVMVRDWQLGVLRCLAMPQPLHSVCWLSDDGDVAVGEGDNVSVLSRLDCVPSGYQRQVQESRKLRRASLITGAPITGAPSKAAADGAAADGAAADGDGTAAPETKEPEPSRRKSMVELTVEAALQKRKLSVVALAASAAPATAATSEWPQAPAGGVAASDIGTYSGSSSDDRGSDSDAEGGHGRGSKVLRGSGPRRSRRARQRGGSGSSGGTVGQASQDGSADDSGVRQQEIERAAARRQQKAAEVAGLTGEDRLLNRSLPELPAPELPPPRPASRDGCSGCGGGRGGKTSGPVARRQGSVSARGPRRCSRGGGGGGLSATAAAGGGAPSGPPDGEGGKGVAVSQTARAAEAGDAAAKPRRPKAGAPRRRPPPKAGTAAAAQQQQQQQQRGGKKPALFPTRQELTIRRRVTDAVAATAAAAGTNADMRADATAMQVRVDGETAAASAQLYTGEWRSQPEAIAPTVSQCVQGFLPGPAYAPEPVAAVAPAVAPAMAPIVVPSSAPHVVPAALATVVPAAVTATSAAPATGAAEATPPAATDAGAAGAAGAGFADGAAAASVTPTLCSLRGNPTPPPPPEDPVGPEAITLAVLMPSPMTSPSQRLFESEQSAQSMVLAEAAAVAKLQSRQQQAEAAQALVAAQTAAAATAAATAAAAAAATAPASSIADLAGAAAPVPQAYKLDLNEQFEDLTDPFLRLEALKQARKLALRARGRHVLGAALAPGAGATAFAGARGGGAGGAGGAEAVAGKLEAFLPLDPLGGRSERPRSPRLPDGRDSAAAGGAGAAGGRGMAQPPLQSSASAQERMWAELATMAAESQGDQQARAAMQQRRLHRRQAKQQAAAAGGGGAPEGAFSDDDDDDEGSDGGEWEVGVQALKQQKVQLDREPPPLPVKKFFTHPTIT
jgi:hypothetical protein